MTEVEKKALKDKIITGLFYNNEFIEKIHGICKRNKIWKSTRIPEDVVNETFFHLANYDTDRLIEAYNDSPKRVFALGITIAVRKGVYKVEGHPKHSIATYILHQSNLQQEESINPTDNFENDNAYTKHSVDKDSLTDTPEALEADLWSTIREGLDAEENLVLDYHLNLKKRGKLCLEQKLSRNRLLEKMKSILEYHKIKRV
jgi:hypothetical protein